MRTTRRAQAEQLTNAEAEILNLDALMQSPGFAVRLLQIDIFSRFYPFFDSMGLSPVEYAILMIVRDNRGVTQTALASALRMQLPNAIKILSAMETKGDIARTRSTKDRRAIELKLTLAGRKRAEAASARGDAFNSEVMTGLSGSEQRQFLTMLKRLIRGGTAGN